jgi:hypothetical protein
LYNSEHFYRPKEIISDADTREGRHRDRNECDPRPPPALVEAQQMIYRDRVATCSQYLREIDRGKP